MRRCFAYALQVLLTVALIAGGLARVPAMAGAEATVTAHCHAGTRAHGDHQQAPDPAKHSMPDCCIGCCPPPFSVDVPAAKADQRVVPQHARPLIADPRAPPDRPPRQPA